MPELHAVVVAQTWVLANGGYELELASDLDLKAPRTVLLTRDDAIYTMAGVAEGYPIYFDATYRNGRRRDGRTCQVPDTFTPASPTSHRGISETERTDTQ